MDALVFYSTSRGIHPGRRVDLRRLVRAGMRRPRYAVAASLGWLIRLLTASSLAHVAVGIDRVVLNPAWRGNGFWPLDRFIELYPGLLGWHVVPIRPVQFDQWERMGRKPILPTVVRWMARGRTEAPEDCVSTVAAVLREGGVAVPPRIVSARQLHGWLSRRGYAYEAVAEAR